MFLFITVEVISSSFSLMTGKGRGKIPSHWTIKPESASVSCPVTSCWVCSSHTSFGQFLLAHWTVSVASQAQRWSTPWVSFSGEFLYDGWLLNSHWGSFKGRLVWGLLSVSSTGVSGGGSAGRSVTELWQEHGLQSLEMWVVVSVLLLTSCVTLGKWFLPLWASASSSVESTLISDDFLQRRNLEKEWLSKLPRVLRLFLQSQHSAPWVPTMHQEHREE